MNRKRAARINRKRAGVQELLREIITLVRSGEYDKEIAKLRLTHLTFLVEAYQPYHEELSQFDPNDEGVVEWKFLRTQFYEIAATIKTESTTTENSNITLPIATSTFLEKSRSLKLPTAKIPKFDGDYDKWLSFKNAFLTIVDAEPDTPDLVKFVHLREALVGEPLNKIELYDLTPENYKTAWKALDDAYNHKRVLIAKHLDAILEILPLTITTASSLTKLIDDTKQHVNQLKSLKVDVNDEIIIRAIERALPLPIRRRWEESLNSDEFPTIAEFYKFLNSTICHLVTMEREISRVNTRNDKGIKRSNEREFNITKKPKGEGTNRALVTSVQNLKCMCNNSHVLYRCPVFQQANVNKRREFVSSHNLCVNCLHTHEGECRSGSCKICSQKHHTSLHLSTQVEKEVRTLSDDNQKS